MKVDFKPGLNDEMNSDVKSNENESKNVNEKANEKANEKVNKSSNIKWYMLIIILGIFLITMIILNVNQKKLIDDLEVKLDEVNLESHKANEEIAKLSSANEMLQNELEWIKAYNVDEMAQEITLNNRKISAISELFDFFSNISIFKGKVVSYTDSEAFVVDIELDEQQNQALFLESNNNNKFNNNINLKILHQETHLWVTVPTNATFYAVDQYGFVATESGQFNELVKSDLSGTLKQFYPYSFVFVDDQLVQIYQGYFDFKDRH